MPFRTKNTVSTGRGTYNTRKHTFTGRGPAPAGYRKTPELTIADVPVTTTLPSGRIVHSGPRPTPAPRANALTNSPFALLELNDLLTPGPTARENAEAALRLGVKPRSEVPDLPDIGKAAGTAVRGFVNSANEIAKGVREAAQLPSQRVDNVLGRKTLGKPTLAQLLRASNKGQVRVNKRGKITLPAERKAARGLQGARQQVARSRTVEGPLTPGQKRFVSIVSRGTGLSPRVVAAQTLAEESGSAAQQREAEGNHNWLNIGYFDSGPGALTQDPTWSTPEAAAHATVEFFKGQRFGASEGIQAILPQARGKSDPTQIAAIASSGWASNDAYSSLLTGTHQLVSGGQPDPQAVTRLRQAKLQAQRLGIPTNPTKFNGDVQADKPGTVLVRADAKGMVEWAQSALGTQEGSAKQVRWAAAAGVAASAPWCSVFVAAGLARRGIKPPPNPAYSGSWLGWSGGERVNNLQKAKPGDLLIFDWGDGGITDHVALYAGNGQMVGGNQSDEVNQEAVPSGNIVGIVRPKYQGGAVRVSNATPLPGGAAGGVGAPGAVVGGVPVGPAGQPQTQREAPAAVSVAALAAPTAASAPLPAAFQQFQQGAEREEGPASELDIIQRILRRKRL